MPTDPYVYPGSSCLRNRLGIRDPDALARIEANQTAIILAQLARVRLAGRYDLAHLRAFHRRIFSDIYTWAGELRTVPIAKEQSLFALPEHFAADGLDGAQTEVSMNGYSGGSEAATWAAALALQYAPTLDIVGVAAGGNFPNLDYTTQYLDNSVWYGTEIGVLVSFNRALPQDFNLNQLLNAAGQALAAKDAQDGSGCGGSTLNEPYGNASQYMNFPDSEALADYAPVKRGLDRISLKYGPLPKAPLFLYNSVNDDLAFIQPVDALVADYCQHGVTVDYDRDPDGGDHLSAFVPYWKAALPYLQNAFAGDTPPDNCSTYSAEPGG